MDNVVMDTRFYHRQLMCELLQSRRRFISTTACPVCHEELVTLFRVRYQCPDCQHWMVHAVFQEVAQDYSLLGRRRDDEYEETLFDDVAKWAHRCLDCSPARDIKGWSVWMEPTVSRIQVCLGCLGLATAPSRIDASAVR